MPTKARGIFEQAEAALRAGRFEEAVALLPEVNRSARTASQRELAARLCWRADRPSLGLRLLGRYVRPEGRRTKEAVDEETAEYAACLIRMGASEEGLLFLKGNRAAQAPLYEALALAAQWRYADTVPLLKKYIADRRLDPYRRLVGGVNLAAAMVFERKYDEANVILRHLIDEALDGEAPLLRANLFELACQCQVMKGKHDEAAVLLDRAEGFLPPTPAGTSSLLIRKWRVFNELLRAKKPEWKPWTELRRLAEQSGIWEVARECDRLKALLTGDKALWLRVYAGSPYPAYRRFLARDFNTELPSLPVNHDLYWGAGPGKTVLDLTGEESKLSFRLKAGKVQHRLLLALAADFYRPQRVASLFLALYPDEFYNDLSAPRRVREAVRRTRVWIADSDLPLEIIEQNGAYRLQAEPGKSVRVPVQGLASEKESSYHVLRHRLAKLESPFTSEQAACALAIAKRSAQRLLSEAVKEGVLVSQGKASKVRYRLSEKA